MPDMDPDRIRAESTFSMDLDGDQMEQNTMGGIVKSIYEGLLSADFSPAQALYLTACSVTGNPIGNTPTC